MTCLTDIRDAATDMLDDVLASIQQVEACSSFGSDTTDPQFRELYWAKRRAVCDIDKLHELLNTRLMRVYNGKTA